MGGAVGEVLPFAIGVAISPIPIVAVILILFTDRARQNGLAFLAGWVPGIAIAMGTLVAVASATGFGSEDRSSDTRAWIQVVLGAVLVAVAIRRWRARPSPDSDPAMPGWMERIDRMKPGAALGLALLLAVNPKNLLLMIAAALAVTQAGLDAGDETAAIAVFTGIAAVGVAVPTLGYVFAGARVQPALDRAKAWLVAHNAAVMAGLFLVLGVWLLAKGVRALV